VLKRRLQKKRKVKNANEMPVCSSQRIGGQTQAMHFLCKPFARACTECWCLYSGKDTIAKEEVVMRAAQENARKS